MKYGEMLMKAGGKKFEGLRRRAELKIEAPQKTCSFQKDMTSAAKGGE